MEALVLVLAIIALTMGSQIFDYSESLSFRIMMGIAMLFGIWGVSWFSGFEFFYIDLLPQMILKEYARNNPRLMYYAPIAFIIFIVIFIPQIAHFIRKIGLLIGKVPMLLGKIIKGVIAGGQNLFCKIFYFIALKREQRKQKIIQSDRIAELDRIKKQEAINVAIQKAFKVYLPGIEQQINALTFSEADNLKYDLINKTINDFKRDTNMRKLPVKERENFVDGLKDNVSTLDEMLRHYKKADMKYVINVKSIIKKLKKAINKID